MRRALLPLLAPLLAACSSAPAEPDPAAVAGRWGSTFSSEFVDLALEQRGEQVGGTAELTPRGQRASYTVTGTVRGGELAATLRRAGSAETISLRATLRRDTLTVRLDGGGFADRRVPLVRI